MIKIDLATIQDVPALLDLQRKAFGPLCEELDWKDAPVLTESLEHAYEEFARCTTLKVQNDKGIIIGSANLTGTGMGMKSPKKRNFEAGILTDDPEMLEAAIEQFDNIWIGKFCKDCGRREYCSDPIK